MGVTIQLCHFKHNFEGYTTIFTHGYNLYSPVKYSTSFNLVVSWYFFNSYSQTIYIQSIFGCYCIIIGIMTYLVQAFHAKINYPLKNWRYRGFYQK